MYRRSDPEGPRGSNPLSSCLPYPITRQFRPVRSRWFAFGCVVDACYELRTSVSSIFPAGKGRISEWSDAKARPGAANRPAPDAPSGAVWRSGRRVRVSRRGESWPWPYPRWHLCPSGCCGDVQLARRWRQFSRSTARGSRKPGVPSRSWRVSGGVAACTIWVIYRAP